jgi:CRISPR system Cascade subunit CasE
LGVLYRLETNPRTGQVTLLLQSAVAPDWSRLEPGYLADAAGEDNPACKSVDEHYGRLAPGMRLAFRLRANPTRKIDTHSGPGGERRNGRRVELRREEEQIDWLRRKGAECGFGVVEARARPAPGSQAAPPGEQTGIRSTVGQAAVLFEGELVITDAARFREALAKGIGPAKAYGFGLLSVAPAGR